MACAATTTGTGLISTLLGKVDSIGCDYVQFSYKALADSLTSGGNVSVAGLMLTLYVIFWGFGLWQGTATGGPSDHAFRLLRAFMIYALATSWSDFQNLVYNALNDGPSAIGTALLTSASANNTGVTANLNSANGVQTALQNMWDTTGFAAAAAAATGGITNPGAYIIAAMLLIVMAILVGYALFLVILAKLFLWLLLALAPIFIILLLFDVSSRFFSGWLSTLVNYFVVQVLVYAFLAFYISMTQSFFDRVIAVNGATKVTLAEIAPILLIGIIGILLLAQITHVASAISGGIAMGAPSLGSAFRRGGRSLMNARVPFTSMKSIDDIRAGGKRARVGHRAQIVGVTIKAGDERRRMAQKISTTF